MKNRERLLKTCDYDLLVRMNEFLLEHGGHDAICVLEALEGRRIWPCLNESRCEECIGKWMNEEECYASKEAPRKGVRS